MRIYVITSSAGDLSLLVDAWMANPSSHWPSQASSTDGVSGPRNGSTILEAIVLGQLVRAGVEHG
jgi:hypothetical protein